MFYLVGGQCIGGQWLDGQWVSGGTGPWVWGRWLVGWFKYNQRVGGLVVSGLVEDLWVSRYTSSFN